jgi:hypothetical protein
MAACCEYVDCEKEFRTAPGVVPGVGVGAVPLMSTPSGPVTCVGIT